jgi:predicted O-methyltransferase YrrM
MDNINKAEDYCTMNSSQAPSYLLELERETHIKTVNPRMMSGHLQGRLLSMISKMLRPQRILEIGTFTAYATLCLAEGLAKDGNLDTIEVNSEMKRFIHKYIALSPFKDRINTHFGDALKLLDHMDGAYDLVFIDAGKEHYIEYYEKIVPKVKTGGMIIADNVLWSGKVFSDPQDETARFIHRFNRHIREDLRTEIVMLPIRDGISLIRKVSET